MPTNFFPNIKKKTQGRDFNFYQKLTISALNFGDQSVSGEQPDMIITFPTTGIMLANEDNSNIIEWSFNGNTVHGELDPATYSKALWYDKRTVSMIWFRLKAGSAGPAIVRVDAW